MAKAEYLENPFGFGPVIRVRGQSSAPWEFTSRPLYGCARASKLRYAERFVAEREAA